MGFDALALLELEYAMLSRKNIDNMSPFLGD